MTTNLPGDESPREYADASPEGNPSVEDSVLARDAVIDQYQSRFPVIINVFNDYFVSSDKSLDFLAKYQKHGEARAEFEGLAEEIRDAIRNPKDSTPLVNAVLGSALTSQESRSMLSELLDQMLEQGDFSPQALEEADEKERKERTRPDAETMVTYYARRQFAIPVGSLKRFEYPLWMWLAGSAVVLLFGVGLGYLPWPQFMQFLPITFLAIGVLGLAFCAVAMLGLRDEILDPDKEERREQEKAQFRQKRDAKRGEKESLAERIRRTLS